MHALIAVTYINCCVDVVLGCDAVWNRKYSRLNRFWPLTLVAEPSMLTTE
jgi:hypothetical protein